MAPGNLSQISLRMPLKSGIAASSSEVNGVPPRSASRIASLAIYVLRSPKQYNGKMYRAVGVILAACFAPFLAAQSFIGAGGCASSNCHGGTVAASEPASRIWGNEYAIWSLNDKHAKAW